MSEEGVCAGTRAHRLSKFWIKYLHDKKLWKYPPRDLRTSGEALIYRCCISGEGEGAGHAVVDSIHQVNAKEIQEREASNP